MASLILALLLAGGQQTAPQPAHAAPTLQQLFDQATKAGEAGRCAEAVQVFEQIEQNPKAMANPTVRAAVDVRKGYCLAQLERSEEGEAAIRRGLPVLAAKGAGFAEEVRQAHLALGQVALLRFDYSGAAAEYLLVLDSATGPGRVRPLMALSQVTMFDQDGAAIRYAGEARSIALADPSFDKKARASVQTQYARALLNAGRAPEAYAELKDSLRKQGGLTTKVGISDLVTRSDLAIAAWLNHDAESARNYLAYTGAGRFEKSPFERARDMTLPACGAETGLKPDDMAIVQFSLAEDGHVAGVLPVYAPAGRTAAIAFAREVRGWSWTPEDARAIPPLFRLTTRMEMRCTNAAERPDLTQPLAAAAAAWLESKGVSDAGWSALPDAKAAPLERAALAAARAKGDRPGVIAAALALVENSVVPEVERRMLAAEASSLAEMLSAPPAVRAYLELGKAEMADEQRGRSAARRALLARLEFQNDPLVAATLRLLIAMPGYRTPAPSDADALLAAVVAAPSLPERHPLKVAALLQRANLAAKHGDLAAAQRAFAQTGLTSRQCALLGLKPAMRSTGDLSNLFPDTAQRLGFEGWVRTEFDVATDGKTIAPRVVSSYPAFVFDEAANTMAKGLRYTSSYRPEDGVACSAQDTAVAFRISHMPK
ncbi:energy transducer TonB [Sphingomonas sp.]|uniref:energy transducer TonB n=1 Tax=Sphingomonas sp. TaxID=28214 RepID=UPI0028A76A75|nr:energy transducer TonB [Sphingomonas sp.]